MTECLMAVLTEPRVEKIYEKAVDKFPWESQVKTHEEEVSDHSRMSTVA